MQQVLVQVLHHLGEELPAGSFVMSGGITEAIAVKPGDSVIARFQELDPPLELAHAVEVIVHDHAVLGAEAAWNTRDPERVALLVRPDPGERGGLPADLQRDANQSRYWRLHVWLAHNNGWDFDYKFPN